MSRRANLSDIEKLWKTGIFLRLSQVGKYECNFIQNIYEKILDTFSTFQRSILVHMSQLFKRKVNTPFFTKIRKDIEDLKQRIDLFMKKEQQTIGDIFCSLSQFKFIVETSQMKAHRQFVQKVKSFTNNSKNEQMTKKIYRTQRYFDKAPLNEKLNLRNLQNAPQFQRWLADFDIRTRQFTIAAYSHKWEQRARDNKNNYIRLLPQRELDHLIFKDSSINYQKSKIEQPQLLQIIQESQASKQASHSIEPTSAKVEPLCKIEFKHQNNIMDEEKPQSTQGKQINDIVSQIFAEIEKNNSLEN